MDIRVESYKWDGRMKYAWHGTVTALLDDMIVVRGAFSREFMTPYYHFYPGDVTIEYYPLDTWYNICEIYGSSDRVQAIYCNMAAPPTFRNGVLSYIDLELDLFVDRNGDVTLLDEAEFEHLAATQLPKDIVSEARMAWEELCRSLKNREGYFKEIKQAD
jgi:protein associated with RNAse G/E